MNIIKKHWLAATGYVSMAVPPLTFLGIKAIAISQTDVPAETIINVNVAAWGIVAAVIFLFAYLGKIRKRLREKRLLSEANVGHVTTGWRLVQFAETAVGAGIFTAIVFGLYSLLNNENFIWFLVLLFGGQLVGNGVLVVDSAIKDRNRQLSSLENVVINKGE